MDKKIVYICHCLDTEGPLYESPEETILRINYIFKTNLEPDPKLLDRLKREEIDLGGLEKKISKILTGRLTNFLSTWDQIDKMLNKALSKDFRNTLTDSFGGGGGYITGIV